jgi:hypothetical protein
METQIINLLKNFTLVEASTIFMLSIIVYFITGYIHKTSEWFQSKSLLTRSLVLILPYTNIVFWMMYLSAFTVSVYFMNIVVSIVILLSFIILYLSSKNKLDKGFIDKEKHRVNIIWYLILYFILTITCNYTIYQTGKFEFGDYIGVFIIIALYISEILSGNLKIEIQYDSAKDTRKELENS